jgi:hypothetical protein
MDSFQAQSGYESLEYSSLILTGKETSNLRAALGAYALCHTTSFFRGAFNAVLDLLLLLALYAISFEVHIQPPVM